MNRVRSDTPSNDNLETANDNRKRAEYMREYMARRRQGGKTLRQLLIDGLAVVAAHAPEDDLEARIFIAAVRDLLEAPDHAKEEGR